MSQSRRILIVDDDHEIREGTHFRLRSVGYETLQADNGKSGVDSAVANHPDAIVMDVRMPEMNEVEAMERLKKIQETANIPVVFVSASLNDEKVALDKGARFFIRKPYSSKDLVAAIDAVTDSTAEQRGKKLTTRIPASNH